MYGKKMPMPPMKGAAKAGEKAKPMTRPMPKRGQRAATHVMKKSKSK